MGIEDAIWDVGDASKQGLGMPKTQSKKKKKKEKNYLWS